MEKQTWRKILQKQIYDVISHRYGLLVVIVGTMLIVISAFHFGESVVEWSTEKYAAVFNSFSDNLAGKSFRERLCLPVPIDVVYTWVNGSDPDLIRSLQKLKLDLKGELNTSSDTKCVFSNCLHSNTLVLDPAVPIHWTISNIGEITPAFLEASKLYRVTSPVDLKNYTAVVFSEDEKAEAALNQSSVIHSRFNITLRRCYITSDAKLPNGIPLIDQIIMSGFPHTLTVEELKLKLPEKLQKGIEKIEINTEKGLAVLHVPLKEDFDRVLSTSNFTIEGKQPTLNAANLVWDLRDFSKDEDISSSRFEDNEELRYSLRSLEKFAPWIRNVYIVTNGQLPYWLNLENPRISIVTHDQIFLNQSHLPSFGSPAIESNLHRIPGLSDKFIYMNDDVMFGKEVWPDDFFTHSQGQKVYLTWPVPNCNEGCPSSWIRDGYCDKACNVSECEWDAGDCNGSDSHVGQHQQGGWAGHWGADNQDYCHTGCANNWIADRYCDTACNVRECAFDAGDCGTDNFDKLHGIQLLADTSQYQLPKGMAYGYFNLTSLLSGEEFSVKNAYYDDNKVIRTIAVSRKFHILTVVLLAKQNRTTLDFTLVYGKGNHTSEYNFTLTVDTTPDETTEAPIVLVTNGVKADNISMATNVSKTNITREEVVTFHDVPLELQNPRVLTPPPTPDLSQLLNGLPASLNLSQVKLPPHLQHQYSELLHDLEQGEITEIGYKLRIKSLWIVFEKERLLNHTKSHVGEDKPGSLYVEKGQGQVRDGKLNEGQKLDNVNPIENENLGVKDTKGQVVEGHNTNDGAQDKIVKDPELRRRMLSWESNEAKYDMEIEEEGEEATYIDDVDIQPEDGKLLPWEEAAFVKEANKNHVPAMESAYVIQEHHGRRLLDTFGDSLRHVNTLYNKAFGYTARKVPGHMPHMIDKHIMTELQDRFPAEWEATSSHQVRHSKDMQYAFSYFYYLMGVKKVTTAAHVFDDMDTDRSRILSDREIRTLATRLYDLPLDLATLTRLENMFINCSKHLPSYLQYQPDMGELETYYEKDMPQVTRNLFMHCSEIEALVKKYFPPQSKYKHVISDDSEIAFKMIKTNVSTVVGQLDDIRKHPKKFICLNDNIDHSQGQASTVKAILQDFYESILPIQSQFELPREYRNRFTHIHELRQWRRYRDWLKFWTHIALVLLVIFTVASYFADKIEAAQKRFMRRRETTSAASTMETV